MNINEKTKNIIFISFVSLVILAIGLIQYYKIKNTPPVTRNGIMLTATNYPPPKLIPKAEELKEIKVYICGEIKKPGVYSLKSGTRVEDIMNLAGGPTSFADMLGVNLAQKLEDEDQIIIPKINENGKNEKKYSSHSHKKSTPKTKKNQKVELTYKININSADIKELDKLPGVGEVTAKRIIEYRKTHGNFTCIEDLMNVSGIGEKTFQKMKNFITVD